MSDALKVEQEKLEASTAAVNDLEGKLESLQQVLDVTSERLEDLERYHIELKSEPEDT